MSGNTMDKAIDLAKKATDADREEKYDEAMALYNHTIQYFLHALKYEVHEDKAKASVWSQCHRYLVRAEELEQYLKKKKRKKESKMVECRGSKFSSSKKDSSKDSSDDSDSDEKKLKDQLSGTIETEKPNVKWSDVAGLEGAKQALQESVIFPVRFPQLFASKCRKPLRRILLYGPPGTGKSYLAKAVATETGTNRTFFSVSSSDLVSKFLRESERLVKNLFEMARASKPAIIFIDQIDFLCEAKDTSEAANRIKTEFLTQMQRVGVDNDELLVLGATSIPWRLDSDICRGFEKRIYTPLPDEPARKQLLELHLGDIFTTLNDCDYMELVKRTENYSGFDICVAVREALMEPVRKVQRATHHKYVSKVVNGVTYNDFLMLCSPDDQGAMEMNWLSIPGEKLIEPQVTRQDFEKVLSRSRPSVNTADLKQFEDFINDFGQEG